MRANVYYFLVAIVFLLIGWFANTAWHLPASSGSPVAQIKPRPFEKYTIENLTNKYPEIEPAQINIGHELEKTSKAPKTGSDFTPHEFTFSFDPTLTGGPKKTVSGLINIPEGKGPFPVVIMFRGYVDQKQYFTGAGTQHAGEFFASEGFITIAPDFLGYGASDSESADILESRFQTYTTAITLIKSVSGPAFAKATAGKWDNKNVFIWAHSNGGQVALTALEITGAKYPTTLWAPNSAKFPYSILYYLDEAEDQGKLIITKLSDFMGDYDVKNFAFNYYLDRIKAPVEIEQGTSDEAVPVLWNNALSKKMEGAGIPVTYIKYPGADHNFQPLWNLAIQNSLKFFKLHIEK